MTEPCPTCGHTPDPSPADWLTPPEVALVTFLSARLAEDREQAERDYASRVDDDRKVWLVRICDVIATTAAVVAGYAWTRDRRRRLVLWRPLLILAAPYTEHPDYRPEWAAWLTRGA